MKCIIATPVYKRPQKAYLDSLKASIAVLDAAEIEHGVAYEVGCPYISQARATCLRKALDARADMVVFIDEDVAWEPEGLLRLIQTEGEVVAGNYRFKLDEESYMGRLFEDKAGRPIVRDDGCVKAEWIPAGFLKVTATAVHKIMGAHPELVYGPRYYPFVDLFNHGAHEGLWWGEDYAFSRRWNAMGEEIWVVPDLNLDHHTDDRAFKGNFHEFLLRQPGGSESDKPLLRAA